jgi:hypothetical protein
VGFVLLSVSAGIVLRMQAHASPRLGIGGAIVDFFDPQARRSGGLSFRDRVIQKTDQGFIDHGCYLDSETADAVLLASASGKHDVWWVHPFQGIDVECVWAPTAEVRRVELWVEHWVGTLLTPPWGTTPPDELREIRRVAVESIDRRNQFWLDADRNALITTGVWRKRSVIWWGWMVNAMTVTGLGITLWTLPLVERDIRRHQRALVFLRAHACGWCGYDVRGIAGEVCPECGRALRQERP